MADQKLETPPTVQLDVDWLVGKRPDPRLHLPTHPSKSVSRFSPNVVGAVLGASVASLLLLFWPHLSAKWIEGQLALAIPTLNDQQETALVNALDELEESNANHISSQVAVAGDRQVEDQHREWHAILRFDQVAQPWVFEEESKDSAMNYKLSNIDSISPVGEQGTYRLASRRPIPSTGSLENSFRFESFDIASSVHLPVIPAPAMDALTSVENYTGRGTPMALVSSSNSRLETTDQPNPLRSESPRQQSPQLLFQGNSVAKPKEALRVEEQSLFSLFTLLSSEQEAVVRQACEELFRRRVPTDAVDLALSLSREPEEARLILLEEVVRLDNALSLPLLEWLARTKEFRTRQRAISMIGAMQSSDATRTLRNLAQRESDPRLLQAIQKSLSSNGNLRQSTNVGMQ